MQPNMDVSPALMNWTAKSWPAVRRPIQRNFSLPFMHVRTTRLANVDLNSGCSTYGHTLWVCNDNGEVIGLGWDWALLDCPPYKLLVADVMSVASNLRFIDEVQDRYLSAARSTAFLNQLVAALEWRGEVAREAGLDYQE